MNTTFVCKIKYDKLQDDGNKSKTTELYLVRALSFSEAEERITESIINNITKEFYVDDIKPVKIYDVLINEDGDRFFKVKINWLMLNEKTGKEKKQPANILVYSFDINSAKSIFETEMKKTMADYVIEKIEETKILDAFLYNSDGNV